MYKADYHLHTDLSLDSDAPMESQVKRAIELGFDEIVITDHHESNASLDEDYYIESDLSSYIQKFKKIKNKYEDEIIFKFGAEIGYEPRGSKELSKFVNSHPFDFIICSIHSLHGEDLYFGDFFKGKSKKTAYTDYFLGVYDCVSNFDDFDVFGHLDFICRYGGYKDFSLDYRDYQDVIDSILKKLIHNSKGIELNTSGIRYKVGHMHPRRDILKRYNELGGEIITIGSDAHAPEDVGVDYNKARFLLKDAGFRYFTVFDKRKSDFIKL